MGGYLTNDYLQVIAFLFIILSAHIFIYNSGYIDTLFPGNTEHIDINFKKVNAFLF